MIKNLIQGDDGRLPIDNSRRHRDEDEDCTKGEPSFTKWLKIQNMWITHKASRLLQATDPG